MLSSASSETVAHNQRASKAIVQLSHVSRIYAEAAVAAVADISFEIEQNAFVAITGPSGCGKSTLLHLIGALDVPTSGEIIVDGVAIHSAGDAERTLFRRRKTGMVFQFFNLLPTMTVRENVMLPLLLDHCDEAADAADELIELVGLGARANHFPHQLSGGELQRAAIARALIHRPKILLADEPTGNLDSGNAGRILKIFSEIAARNLTTLIVVTHSREVAAVAGRQISMRDGRLSDW